MIQLGDARAMLHLLASIMRTDQCMLFAGCQIPGRCRQVEEKHADSLG